MTPETVAILSTHKQRAAQQCLELGTTLTDEQLRVLLGSRPPATAGTVGYPLATEHDQTIILVYEYDPAI